MKSTAESPLSRLVLPILLLLLVSVLCGAVLAAVDKKQQPGPAEGTPPTPIDLPEGGVPGERPSRFPAALPERAWTGKWLSAAPAQLGFDPVGLRRSADAVGRMEGVYSLLVVRNGYLVTERYFREGYREKPHNMKSASKSVLSALVGIAVDEGLLSLDQPICPLLPQCDRLDDPRKARITVWHLLTMTSGLAPTSYDAYGTWTANGDWVRNALVQPLEADPGTRYAYSTGDTHVLSAVLTAATGKSTYDWAVEKLFDPMDITVHGWSTDPRGIYQGGNNLSLTPRDMAKIGMMYLSGGTFGGRRIVPEWWVEASTRDGRWDDHPVYGRYKYLWYAEPNGQDAFVAVGYGGQYIYVSPPHNCVVVVTATLITKGREWERLLFERIQDGILGSFAGEPGPVLLAAGTNDSTEGLYLAQSGEGAVDGGDDRSGLARQVEGDLPSAAEDTDPDLPVGETSNNVVLRSGPTQESLRLEIVPAGQRVDILDTQGLWHLVLYEGKAGWLHGDYVNVPERPAVPGASKAGPALAEVSTDDAKSPALEAGGIRGWTRTRLKLRSGPSRDDTVLTTLDKGSPLVIEEKAGSWLAVKAGPISGWVHAAYVRMEPEDAETLARAPDDGPSGAAPQVPPESRVDDEAPAVDVAAVTDAAEPEQIPPRTEPVTGSPRAAIPKTPPTPAEPAESVGLMDLGGRVEALVESVDALAVDTAKTFETVSSQGDGLKAQETAIAQVVQNQERFGRDLAAAGEKILSLEKSLDLEQASRQNLMWNLTKIIEELENQREADARSETSRQQLQADIAGIGDRLGELGASIDAARQPSPELQQTLAALRKSIEDQQAADARAVDERKGLKDGLAELGGQLAGQQTQMAESEKAGKALADQLADLRNGLTPLVDRLDTAVRSGEALQAAVGAMQETSKTQQDAAAEGAAERETLKGEMVSMREALVADQTRLAAAVQTDQRALAAELERIGRLIGSMSEALQTAQATREMMQTEIDGLGKDLNTRQDADAATRATALFERDALRAELAGIRREMADRNLLATQAETARSAVAAEIVVVRNQVTDLRDTLLAVRAELDSNRTVMAALKEGLENRPEPTSQTARRPDPPKPEPRSAEGPGVTARTAPADTWAVPEGLEAGSAPAPDDAVRSDGPQAPGPASKPTPPAAVPSPERDAVEPFVRSWAEAWARKDVKAYLAHYSELFQPAEGIGLAEWKGQRKQRLLKPAFIEIDVADVRKEPAGTDGVRVTFEQMYRSNTYIDRSVKVLDLKWESGGWKIVKEASSKR